MADTDESTATYDEALNLVDVAPSSIYTDVVTGLEREVGEPLYPGDERRIFGEALVAVLVAYVSKANDASRQTLLRYARGEVLDAIGERLGVERLRATPASCTIRLTLSATFDRAITIPAGTRVTSDGTLYWQTSEACPIPAGSLTGEVEATCTTPGTAGNGVPAGAIATLVDMQPYVAEVTNVDETGGGDDGEPYTTEGDDRLRERIRLAPSKLSTAGPEQAYVYWAMSADAGIADVCAFSETYDDNFPVKVVAGHAFAGGDQLRPDQLIEVEGEPDGFTWFYEKGLLDITLGGDLADEDEVALTVRREMAGHVKVVPLMEGGELPGEDVLEKVREAVSARDIRPMTDLVSVEAPTVVEYPISLTYTTTPEREAAVVEAVEGPGGAIDRYVAEQCSRLGRDINPDVLKTYVMEAGAIRCDVTKPAHRAVAGTQVAKHDGDLTVSHTLETQARWSD